VERRRPGRDRRARRVAGEGPHQHLEPAVLAFLDGGLFGVFVVESDGELVHGLRVVVNPDKLPRSSTTSCCSWPVAVL
jgi:hypothetical protein